MHFTNKKALNTWHPNGFKLFWLLCLVYFICLFLTLPRYSLFYFYPSLHFLQVLCTTSPITQLTVPAIPYTVSELCGKMPMLISARLSLHKPVWEDLKSQSKKSWFWLLTFFFNSLTYNLIVRLNQSGCWCC